LELFKVQAQDREVTVRSEALWYVAPGRAELRSEPLPEPGPGEIQVRTLFSGISRGTERLVFGGRVPESEYERMRAPFMGGSFPFPVKFGYAAVGRVERGSTALAGRVVFGLCPHQDILNVPAESVVPLPDGVLPSARAVLAANMETALNAVWDARPAPGDRITVVGAGVVGALVAWLCGRMPGAQVTLIDVDPTRAALARSLGVAFSSPEAAPGDCDLVVHATGRGEGLSTALRLAGTEATILELSWYGSGEIPVALGGAFHSRRLKLVASQVGEVAPSHRPRWSRRRRLTAALDLLREPRLDTLLAAPIDFRDVPARLPDILAPESGVLCQVVRYPAADAAT
jgi:threonine dehydrogenase-like Zn-dependent dehydrogenase